MDDLMMLENVNLNNIINSQTSWSSSWPAYSSSDAQAYFSILRQARLNVSRAYVTSDGELHRVGVPLALCITAIVLACVAVGFATQHVIQASLNARTESLEKTDLQSLEGSYERIQTFVNNISIINADGIKGVEGKQVTSIERDVYSMEPSVKQLISFLHPAVARASSNGLLPAPQAATTGDLIPLGMNTRAVTILLVDIEGIHCKPTTESAKVMPKDFLNMQTLITQEIEKNEGVVHCIVGAKLIAIWNQSVCNDSESNACTSAVNILKQLPTELQFIRFAVVSGEVATGLCGTAHQKTFTILGQLIPLGVMLLRLNRVHGTSVIVNDATFGKLDAQIFRTRPVEVVALESTSRRSVAFELVIGAGTGSDKDGRVAAWNEAFDDYKNGNTSQSKTLFKSYMNQFGESKSAHRIVSLLCHEPPRHCTYRYSDDGFADPEIV